MFGDLSNVESEFGAMPEGDYIAIVEKMEERVSKNGNRGLNVKFKIVGDKRKNAVLFRWLTLDQNSAGFQYAQQFFKSVLEATSQPLNTYDINAVMNKPITIVVKHRKGQDGNAEAGVSYCKKATLKTAMNNISLAQQQPKPQPTVVTTAAFTTDEIPF